MSSIVGYQGSRLVAVFVAAMGLVFTGALVPSQAQAATPSNQYLAAWGANNNGQLGNSSTTATSLPSSVLTSGALAGKTVTQVTAGEAHSCAVTSDGGVYCWGSNTYGQLGNNSWSQSAVPIAVDTTGVLAGKAVIQVEAGYRHTCAVTSDGAAFCWGYNAFGQLGNNSTGSSPVPVAVDTSGVLAGKTLTQVASGGYHTCALSADAAVFCWGHGTAGNLGNNGWTHSQVPVAVDNNGVLAGKTVTQLDSGFHHACVVTSDGGVFCWGYNVFGQLGDGTMTGSAAPVAVDISGALASKTIAQVATGYYQTCALSTDGAVFCWGVNDYGQLGNDSGANSPVPVGVVASGVLAGKAVTQIASGYPHTCAVTTDGAMYCWGSNYEGQLGNTGYPTTVAVPVAVAPVAGSYNAPRPVLSVATGGYHTIAIYGDNPALIDQYAAGWGDNGYGQLGNGASTDSLVPTTVLASGALAGKTVTQVSAGVRHACAVTSEGRVYCWGNNDSGQLGDRSMTYRATPVEVFMSGALAGKAVTQVAGGYAHTCAVTADGSAYCWGSNGSGALGAEEISWSLEPLAVNAAGVLAGKTVTQVDAGHYHSCAVTSDGGVQCWGYNSEGQLGNASITSSYIPVAVDVSGALSGKSVTQVTAGYLHSCAVTSDGGAYCWGYNHYQVLGTNSPDSSLTPLAVERSGALAGKTVTQVSSHDYHACALTSDGGVYCWGMNWYGMLGDNSLSSSGVPVAVVDTNGVLSGKTLAQVSVGLRHSCVVASDGSTYCWGSNDNGELGDNSTSSSRVPVAVTPVAGSFNAPKPVMSIAAGGYMTLAVYGFAVRPGAPSGLVAVGAPGALELSWQPPVMAGGSPVTQYWVFYRPTGLTTWKVFARGISTTELPLSTNATQPGPCSGAASCPRLHGSLQVGTSYDFQLVAVNSSGNGRWSNMVTVLWFG